MPSAEILAVLADEVNEAGEAIAALLARLVTAPDEAAFQETKTEYAERVQRIAVASDALKLAGLYSVCGFVERNLSALRAEHLEPEGQRLFERWPQLVLGYLKTPLDGVYSRELAELFQRPAWPAPLDAAAAQALEQELLSLEHADTETPPPMVRESIASPEDVALTVPGDVNQKLVDAFLTEGPLQAAEYTSLIQRIVKGDGWIDELNECRRLIHALKGAGNTVGVRGVATLCHHVEDILEYLVENATPPRGELGRLLIKVADTLDMMFEALLGTGPGPSDSLAVLQTVLDCVNRIDRGEFDGSLPAAATEAARLIERRGTGAPAEAPAARTVSAAEQVEAKVRVAVRTIDSLLRTAGELNISSAHVRERMQQAFKTLNDLREHSSILWDRTHDLEALVTTQGIAAGRRHAAAANATGAQATFDALELDQYSELHTHVQGLMESVADLQMLGVRLIEAMTAVNTATEQQASLHDEVHETLMTSRMAPAGNLEARLQRTARQAAEQCGKQVEFRLEGADVRLDDQMMNVLIDPLQHMLRNAIDHGIEAPAARAQAGKPEAGQVTLRFARDGNYLLITCHDDGAGLDSARIRARAISLGLIAEDENLSDEQAARLILRPGFSTAKTVTELSGRGVGMDIVHTSVARLKGTMDIRTHAGAGTTFMLRVPLSLGIAHCLMVQIDGKAYALPTDNLDRIVYEGARQIAQTEDGWLYRDEDISCPAHSLAQLVGLPENPNAAAEGKRRHVVLMNDILGRFAIVVDAVTGGMDLVIKSLGRYLIGVRGLVGASILGDGSVVPILHLTELLRLERRGNALANAVVPDTQASTDRPVILVVDDSLSVRTALAALLSEEGYEVRTAKDGLEAIEAIDERLPEAVLADLEMPRMNGIELTAHIRTNEATRDLPVILVTSRTAEKHRNLAREAGVNDYVTKPYREEELLNRLRNVLMRKAA